jgi:S-adenosylmethionine:tRNA ribosyltransferase-isomerase
VKTSELDYELPAGLIAQRPVERRDHSRLLVHDRATGLTRHRRFDELTAELPEGTLVVVNDTRVLPARLRLERPGGGEAEVLLLERLGENGTWEGLARPSRKLRPGQRLGPVELVEPLGDGRWRLRLEGEPAGEAPLPPYITEPLGDPERYQTVYAAHEGSAAAPTAGLHFTPELLERVRARGAEVCALTLHVGPGTFRPLRIATVEAHRMEAEAVEIPAGTAAAVNRARATNRRVIAVGTTTTRALEWASNAAGRVTPGQGPADLFIHPPHRFRAVDALVTNFHLPRSTLLVLVSAFAGRELVLAAYRHAVAAGYRFYSYGDAMLIE